MQQKVAIINKNNYDANVSCLEMQQTTETHIKRKSAARYDLNFLSCNSTKTHFKWIIPSEKS